MALLFDWRTASQPDDLVRQVVAVLQQGGLAVLPTDAGYVIAASAVATESVKTLAARTAAGLGPLEVLLSGPAEIEYWAEPLSLSLSRLLRRLWPGPLGLTAELREPIKSNLSLPGRFRCPRHSAIAALLSTGATLVARSIVMAPGLEQDGSAVMAALGELGELVVAAVDAGPLPSRPVTRVATVSGGWRVEQTGQIGDGELALAAAVWIVFVCTGNTCRSPMAEALFKTMVARRLGCTVEELPSRGYWISSAGLAAIPGDGPSPEAIDVLGQLESAGELGEIGPASGWLAKHRSRLLETDCVAQADQLVAMTRSHLAAVLMRYPAFGGALRLLCGVEGDLDDPIGASIDVYMACALAIGRHLNRLIVELIPR